MKPLFLCELRRLRSTTLATALVHTALLAVSGLGGLATLTELVRGAGLAVYALLGLGLGVFQLGSYRRPGHWSYLLHRPLAPARVFLAVAGAAAAVLAAALGLPLLLVTGLGPWAGDARHLLLAPYLLGFALAFYLAGAFLALAASRARFLVLLVPALLVLPRPAPAAAFATLLLVNLWLLLLALAAFKPDLSTPVSRPLAVAALAVPVTLGLTWALTFALHLAYSIGIAVSVVGWRDVPAFAWNDYYPEGTLARTDYLDAGDALALALRLSGSERARHHLASLEAAAVREIVLLRPVPPRRGQLPLLDRAASWEDISGGVVYSFSHDRMLFAGRSRRTGEPAGWLGAGGFSATPATAAPFESVPTVAGRWLVTERRIYEVFRDGQAASGPSVRARLEVPAREVLLSPFGEKENGPGPLLALTDRALYLVEPWTAASAPPSARMAIPIPGDARNLTRALVASRDEGHLVSFILGARAERELDEARQLVLEVSPGGEVETLVDLPLGQGPPAWVRHRTFLTSPLLSAVNDLAFFWSGPRFLSRATPDDLVASVPRSVLAPALLLGTLAAALTAASARGRCLHRAHRLAWIAGALLAGLPGYLGFLLLTPRPDRSDPPAG